MQRPASFIRTGTGNADRIKRIAVIGAGLMGHRIALEFAAASFPVRMFDSDPRVLASALDHARNSAALLVEAGRLRTGDVPAVLGRIQPADTDWYGESFPCVVPHASPILHGPLTYNPGVDWTGAYIGMEPRLNSVGAHLTGWAGLDYLII